MAAALALAWAVVVALSGGFAVGILVSRDPYRPLIASAILAVAGRLVSPLDFGAALARLTGSREKWPARIAAVAAAATFVVATAWNTRAVGGSDSSCYVLQAEAFAHGHVMLTSPLAGTVGGAAAAMFAPNGFIASGDRSGAAVPICPPGLALLMAGAARVAGRAAVFQVVPFSAALAVWLTFVFGRRAASAAPGVAAAVLLACSPVFLYQAVQPMSDVPAAALWLATLSAMARGDARGQIVGGACASFTVLTRPNLAVAVLPLLVLLRERTAWVRWALAAAPGAMAFMWLNQVRYGSPFVTGYGDAGALFSWAHVAANLARYPGWLLETQTPLVALAIAGPWSVPRDRGRPRIASATLVSCVIIAMTYLAYTVFDDWWYVRFLLPALPVVLLYAISVLLQVMPFRVRGLAAAVVTVALGVWYVHVAVTKHAFELQSLESRFVKAGGYARELPESAVVIAGQQTASIRYYGGRPTLAWDAIPPDELDQVITSLAASGHSVEIALEGSEVPAFTARFASQRYAQLRYGAAHVVAAPGRVMFFPAAP